MTPQSKSKQFASLVQLILYGCAVAILFPGCMSQRDIIARKTPEQVSRWSDAKLCYYASTPNPAIKAELLQRTLLTEEQYDTLLEDDHNLFPRVGMSKCEMWAFSDDTELLSQVVTSDGNVHEKWRLFHGPFVLFESWGGICLWIEIDNDTITNVSLSSDYE